MTTGTDIAVVDEGQQLAIKFLLDLEATGAADEVSLTLTDPDMPYQRWEDLGRFLGAIDRRARWYIGDWLNFGEALYGEEASQAVEATTADRYDEAERVTGLDHGTLMNISSVCRKVPKRNRRKELGFWIHQEVAKLEVNEQPKWLTKAIKKKWTKNELRDAIREAKNPSTDEDDDAGGDGVAGEGSLSVGERIEAAARLVYAQGQNNSDGDFVVPASVWMQLKEALGAE